MSPAPITFTPRANPLTTRQQTAFHNAIKKVVDMFFRLPVTINKRVTTLDDNGENPVIAVQAYNVVALMSYDVGLGGRYHTIEHTDLGQILHDGWKLYFFKEDIDATLTTGVFVDPEADSLSITLSGVTKEYELRMWTPSADFSDLGFLLYECDLRFNAGE